MWLWVPSVVLTLPSRVHVVRSCAGPGTALAGGLLPAQEQWLEKVPGLFLLLFLRSAITLRKLCLLSPLGQERNEGHRVEQNGPARLTPTRPPQVRERPSRTGSQGHPGKECCKDLSWGLLL